MGLNPILNLGIDEVKVRTPMSLEKMTFDAESGTVIYRSKMHLGLKRNFQVTPGAEWLELLCRHIPDRYEHLVRYVGWQNKGLYFIADRA